MIANNIETIKMTYLVDKLPEIEKTFEKSPMKNGVSDSLVIPTKITKPNQKGGRKLGSTQWRRYNWHVTYFDKELDKLIIGKYCTVSHINKELGTKFSSDLIYRLQFLTSESKNSLMLKRWSHIKVVKIDEEIFKESTLSIHRVCQEDLKNYQNQKKNEN